MPTEAYVDPYLAARQLPHRPVTDRAWRGHQLVTHAQKGIPHRFDRLTFAWVATRAAQTEKIKFDIRDVREGMGWPGSLGDVARSFDRLAHSFVEVALPGARQTTAHFSLLTTFERFNLSKRTGRGQILVGSLFRRTALIPVNAQALHHLARRSLPILDQYLWQVTTAWRHRPELPLAIPLDTMRAELACLIQDDAVARYRIKKRQRTIRELCPSCPHNIDGDHIVLVDGGFEE